MAYSKTLPRPCNDDTYGYPVATLQPFQDFLYPDFLTVHEYYGTNKLQEQMRDYVATFTDLTQKLGKISADYYHSYAYEGKSSSKQLSDAVSQLRLILESSVDPPAAAPSPKKLSQEQRFLAIIRDCYFEDGIWTEADSYFEGLVKNSGSFSEPLTLLSSIVNHHLNEEHILEGVLHILSNYDYEKLDPYGITIAIACAVNQSPVIQDLLISCFEKWQSLDSIDILESLHIEEKWLSAYRDQVVDELQSLTRSA